MPSIFRRDVHGVGGRAVVVVIRFPASFAVQAAGRCEFALFVGRFGSTVGSLYGSTRSRFPSFRVLATCASRLRCLCVSLFVGCFSSS